MKPWESRSKDGWASFVQKSRCTTEEDNDCGAMRRVEDGLSGVLSLASWRQRLGHVSFHPGLGGCRCVYRARLFANRGRRRQKRGWCSEGEVAVCEPVGGTQCETAGRGMYPLTEESNNIENVFLFSWKLCSASRTCHHHNRPPNRAYVCNNSMWTWRTSTALGADPETGIWASKMVQIWDTDIGPVTSGVSRRLKTSLEEETLLSSPAEPDLPLGSSPASGARASTC